VIVNRAFAERYWAKGKALGKRLQLEDESGRWSSIVGVVENIKQLGLDKEEGPAIYQPHAQKAINFRWMTVIVRSRETPAPLTERIREQVSAIDKDQPIYNIASMREVLSESVARTRFIMLLMSLFAGTALILSIIGVYGLMSYNTAQIVPEIGIRMALGATRKNVLLFILSKSLQLTTISLIAGAFGAIALTQFTETLLFEIRPLDATTFTLAGLILALSVLVASYLPARRAAGLDPISVLRYE
jgi:putative ABC transport system permease protein